MTGLTEHIRVKPPGTINNYIRRMVVVLSAVILLLVLNYDILLNVIQTNLLLNLAIGTAFLTGTFLCFRNVYRLKADFRALRDIDHCLFESRDMNALRRYAHKTYLTSELLYSLQKNLGNEEGGAGVTRVLPSVARSLFNIVNNGLTERRSMMSYFSNLLLYLGLLGTFIGLFSTVSSINGLIGYLAAGLSGEEDLTQMLVVLIKHLEEPLDGMGVAFGTSLAGLCSSVVLGALAMNVNKAGTIFGNSYSNWLFEFAISASEELRQSRINGDPLAGASAGVVQGSGVTGDLNELQASFNQLIAVAKEQLNRSEATAAEHGKQLGAIYQLLNNQSLSHDMSALNRHMEEQKGLLNQQLKDNEKAFAQAESYHTTASAQRTESLQHQQSLQQQSQEANKTLQAILDQIEQMPESLSASVGEEIKESIDELEYSILQRLMHFVKRYIRHLSRLVRKDSQTKMNKLDQRIKDSETHIRQDMEVQLEEAQNRHGRLTLRVFRALHRLHQLFMRK